MKRLSALLLLVSNLAFAEAVYPPPPDLRPDGYHQGLVGSCMAEAETTAMENAFLVRGMGVSLSSYHAHSYNWKEKPHEGKIYQSYSPDDIRILGHFGRFVPGYMHPEDGRGFYVTGNAMQRPAVSELGVYDFAFPSAGQTGQSQEYYSFAGGYSNTIGLAQVKQFVRERLPVTLSLQGFFVSSNVYSFESGLIKGKFANPPYQPGEDSYGIHHAVAVVGFDDELVAGKDAPPGALIIRNSWNENGQAEGFPFDPAGMSQSLKADFLRFRGKINPARNDAGYFAIPYAYISFLISQGAGGVTVFRMNYPAFYNAYTQFRSRYTVRHLPFYCDEDRSKNWFLNSYPKLLGGLRSTEAKTKKDSVKALMALSSPRLLTQGNWAGLHIARIAQTAEVNRPLDFYQGKFSDYYCGRPVMGFGPQADVVTRPDFQSALGLLTTDTNGISTWLAAYKSIYNYIGEKQ